MAEGSSEYKILLKAAIEEIKQSQLNDALKNTKPIKIKVDTGSIAGDIGGMGSSFKGMQTTSKAVADEIKMMSSEAKKSVSTYEKLANTNNNIAESMYKQEKSQKNLFQTLGGNARKVAEWAVSTAAIYGTLDQIRKGTQYIVDLNKELTNIQIVTGMSSEEVDSLASSYNKLASEMGVTTLEVAAGSTEWFRQGKTIAETTELMKSSLMMSKLGNMQAAEATQYLTSTLNGFKLEAKDAIGVVDKLTAIDNAMATSTAELASALQRSANSAQQAGVSFDELVSYIATVSSVTRKSSIVYQT
jgi:hypothetical protein